MKDPICGMDVDAKSAVLRSEHQGSVYYFCSTYCKTEFDKDPAKYIGAGGSSEHHHHNHHNHHCC